MDWLKEEVCGKYNISFYITVCLIVDLTYNIGLLKTLLALDIHILQINEAATIPPLNLLIFPLLLGMAFFALVEEIAFRLIPLSIAIDREWPMDKVLIVAIISSAIFGFLHGGAGYILFQGATGFMYCILFLKCGGIQKKYGKALKVATTAHFLFNVIVVVIPIVINGTFV